MKSTRKARIAIYLAAAESIEIGESSACCFALRGAGDRGDDRGPGECVERMIDVFADARANPSQRIGYWMAEWEEKPITPETQTRRVLALLFMAELTRCGDA